MNSLTALKIIVLCGLIVAAFVGGRMSVSRYDDMENGTSPRTGGTTTAASDFSEVSRRGGITRSRGAIAPIKSAAELRDTLKELESSMGSELGTMKKIAQLVERLETSDTAAIVREYLQGSPSPEDLIGLELVFMAITEKDPEAAWNLAAPLPPSAKSGILSEVISALAKKSPDSALAKLDGIEDPTLRHSLRRSVIYGLTESDPQRALTLVDTPLAQEDEYLASMIFMSWAKNDTKAVQAALQGMDPKLRAKAVGALAETLAKTDPAAAWKLASENATSERYTFHNDGRSSVLRQWMLTDPKAAMEAVAAVEDNDARRGLMSSTLADWARRDYNAALQHIMGSSDPDILTSGLSTLAQVPGSDRAALFDAILDRVPSGEQYQRAVSQVISNWARDNPREAAAAIEQLPPGNTYTSTVAQVASHWFSTATDKNEPLQWVLAMNPGEARASAIGSIYASWGHSDPAAAAAAAMTLSSEDRSRVTHSILSSLSQKDPQAALQWASGLPDEKQRQDAIQRTLGYVAGSNPQQAIAMLNSLGMGNNAAAVGNVVDNWARNDLTTVSDWVKKLPDGDVRDNALGKVASRYAGDEPETAVAWAQAIADPKARTSAIESVVRTWKRHDAQAATAWVAASTLPEESKNKLLGK